ncbi:MAG: hypothetical protein ACJ751_22860 [Niastella sp.]|uniref:hypothetical protein n=1 Tax=Niastella sp. TaxID=1869183 RepID=UPI00389AFFD0
MHRSKLVKRQQGVGKGYCEWKIASWQKVEGRRQKAESRKKDNRQWSVGSGEKGGRPFYAKACASSASWRIQQHADGGQSREGLTKLQARRRESSNSKREISPSVSTSLRAMLKTFTPLKTKSIGCREQISAFCRLPSAKKI